MDVSDITPAQARKLWIDALRSDRYKQGTGYLASTYESNDDCFKFCCMGVACEIYMENGGKLQVEERQFLGTACNYKYRIYGIGPYNCYNYDASPTVLPDVVRSWLGLKTNNGGIDEHECLTNKNDKGVMFDKIADIIESGCVMVTS